MAIAGQFDKPFERQGMEHRWGSRRAIKQPVYVETAPQCIGKAWLRDVSLTGGYLQCGGELPSSICVRVKFIERVNGRRHEQWIDAHVARRTREGLGLEWFEFAPPRIAKLLSGEAGASKSG